MSLDALTDARALTLRNPSGGLPLPRREPTAFLAGVLHGDGWLTAKRRDSKYGNLGLRSADQDFAEAFATAVTDVFDVPAQAKRDERGYWLVRKYNGYGRFNTLREFEATTPQHRAAWLRGLFDSEGNAHLAPRLKIGPRSFTRSVSFTSTNTATLALAADHLADLGLGSYVLSQPPHENHFGSKPVFRLCLRGSQDQYRAFADVVGSSIARKQATLDALHASYCSDLSAVRREMQADGVAVRLARRDAGGRY